MKPSDALLRAAADALKNAYAPYSRYRVGAAVRAADGSVFSGCNVENASYGLTLCAERAAVCAAIAAGHRRLTAVAIVAEGTTSPYPCGACRQVLAEFTRSDTPVLVAQIDRLAHPRRLRMGTLLPHAFRFAAKKSRKA